MKRVKVNNEDKDTEEYLGEELVTYAMITCGCYLIMGLIVVYMVFFR